MQAREDVSSSSSILKMRALSEYNTSYVSVMFANTGAIREYPSRSLEISRSMMLLRGPQVLKQVSRIQPGENP